MDTNNNETKNTIGENLLSLRTLVKKWISFFLVSIIVILVILLLGFYYLFFRTPDGFVPDTVVNISQGQSLISAAKELRQDHIVTWPTALIVAGVMYKGEHTVVAGDYLFDKPLNVFNVAYRITHGVFNMTPIKVTLPEGTTVSGYSKIILSKIPGFDTDAFWSQASTSEGYLFPDTYFLSPKITATDTINFLTSNFQQKMKSVEPEIAKSGHTENEILTMASILEQEVQTSADRAIVAGILW